MTMILWRRRTAMLSQDSALVDVVIPGIFSFPVAAAAGGRLSSALTSRSRKSRRPSSGFDLLSFL